MILTEEQKQAITNEYNKFVEVQYAGKTKKERQDPDLIKGSQKRRIASGSGTTIQDVNILLKQFYQSKDMMKMLNGKKKGGFKLPF